MERTRTIRGEEWNHRKMIRAGKDCTVWLMYDKYGQKILAALARPFDLDEYKRRKLWNRLR